MRLGHFFSLDACFLFKCCSTSYSLASPKSPILTTPWLSMKMLAGFKSRWIIFLSCTCLIPCNSCENMLKFFFQSIGCFELAHYSKKSFRVSPEQSSIWIMMWMVKKLSLFSVQLAIVDCPSVIELDDDDDDWSCSSDSSLELDESDSSGSSNPCWNMSSSSSSLCGRHSYEFSRRAFGSQSKASLLSSSCLFSSMMLDF